jgi:TP901 family phage tail tape measure protein
MAEVGSLSAKLTLDKASFSSALAGAKGELVAFGSSAEGTFSKIGSALGKSIQAGALVATAALATVTAAAGAGTKAFMEYEKGLQNVGKVSGMADSELQAFGQTMRDMSMETGTSVSALEDLASSLSSAGVANKDLAPNLKLANSMMVALGTDSQKTGGFIGGLSKAMGMSTEEIRQYGSALNVIENGSRATAGYTMDFTEAMIPLGAMFNLDKKALLAFSAVAADAGLQASETATSIDSAVRVALTDKTGMKKESWAKLLGVDVKTLDRMLNSNLLLTLKKSAEALNKITNSTDKATVATTIWGAYGLKSIGSLTGSLGNFDTYYNDVVEDIKTGSNSMTTEETRMMSTLANHFERAKSIINDFGITIGEVTKGPLMEFFTWFEGNAKTMSAALKQALSGDLMGAFTTLGPVIQDVMSTLRTTLESAVTSISGLMSGIDLGDIATRIGDALADLGPKLIDGLGGALSEIGKLPWESYFKKALSAAEKAFASIGEAILKQPWGSWANRAMNVLGSAMQTAVAGAIDLGGWIQKKLNGFSPATFVSAGKTFAGWVIDGLSTLADLVSKNWASWIAGGIQLTGTIVTALGSFASGIVTEIGNRITAKASSVWSGLMSYTGSVVEAAKNLGANIVDGVGMGIASGINSALEPLRNGLNELIRGSNNLLGTNFSEIGSLSVGTGNFYGTSGNTGAAWNNLTSTALSPFKQSQMASNASLGISKYSGDPEGALQALMAQGMSFDEAYNKVISSGIMSSSQTMSYDWYKNKYGMSLSPGGMAGLSTKMQGMGGGSTSWVQAANGITGGKGAYSSTGGILSLLNQAKGNSIVPGGYSVTGGVVDGTKVFVTNWPTTLTGAGGNNGCLPCAIQSVDYGFGDNTKFTGSITPGGPGIGMVGSASSTTPYANRLEVDTCEIDSFGMTPGLGAELARSGAWAPIKGAPVSEKLAAEIGYQGNYSNVGNTAMIGSIKTAYDRANKSQINTQTKVNSLWTDGVSQAANTNAQIGMQVGNYQLQSATFASNIQNNAANTWYNSATSSAANLAANGALAGQNILSSATMGGNSINIASNNLSGILSNGGQSISTGASNLVNATAGLTSATSTLQGMMSSQSLSLNTLMGSLNATALGLTTMGANMGIPVGGSFVSGYGGGGGTGAYNWGSMTSISGGGGWVGTGTGATTLNTRSPYYRSWGGAATSAAVQAATPARSSYTISGGTIKIGKYAEGGMVTRPQIAMIGESGREAVLPPKLVDTIMNGTGGEGGMMAHVSVVIDGKKIADAVGPAIIKRVQQGSGLKVR